MRHFPSILDHFAEAPLCEPPCESLLEEGPRCVAEGFASHFCASLANIMQLWQREAATSYSCAFLRWTKVADSSKVSPFFFHYNQLTGPTLACGRKSNVDKILLGPHCRQLLLLCVGSAHGCSSPSWCRRKERGKRKNVAKILERDLALYIHKRRCGEAGSTEDQCPR